MSFADMLEAFADDVQTAKEAVIEVQNVREITTPLFTITFKNHTINDIEIDPTKGLIASNIFNMCDKFIIQIASNAITGRQLICGDEAVANDTAPNFMSFFTENGQLKNEFSTKLTESQIMKVEILYAETNALLSTVRDLIDNHRKMFPTSKYGPQLAYNINAEGANKGIYNLKDAIQYRIQTSSKLRDIKRSVENRLKSTQVVDALKYASIHEVLNF